MSRTVTIDGEDYSLPTGSEKNWLAAYNRLLLALITYADSLAARPEGGSFFSFGVETLPSDGGNYYLTPGYSSGTAPTGARAALVPKDGTLSLFRVSFNGSEISAAFTVHVNGSPTALTVDIAGESEGSDVTHEVAVNAGDRVAVAIDTDNVDSGVVEVAAVITFTPDDAEPP